jgi:hypothetical protein
VNDFPFVNASRDASGTQHPSPLSKHHPQRPTFSFSRQTQLERQKLGKEKKLAKMITPATKVLVYQHRHNAANPIVADGLAVMTTSELDTILSNRKYLQNPSPDYGIHC